MTSQREIPQKVNDVIEFQDAYIKKKKDAQQIFFLQENKFITKKVINVV